MEEDYTKDNAEDYSSFVVSCVLYPLQYRRRFPLWFASMFSVSFVVCCMVFRGIMCLDMAKFLPWKKIANECCLLIFPGGICRRLLSSMVFQVVLCVLTPGSSFTVLRSNLGSLLYTYSILQV